MHIEDTIYRVQEKCLHGGFRYFSTYVLFPELLRSKTLSKSSVAGCIRYHQGCYQTLLKANKVIYLVRPSRAN